MIVGLIGYALFYLFFAFFLMQVVSDSYSILFINMTVVCLKFLLFGTLDTSHGTYFFSYNQFIPSLHNFWIAYILACLFALLHFFLEFRRHSPRFRD